MIYTFKQVVENIYYIDVEANTLDEATIIASDLDPVTDWNWADGGTTEFGVVENV